MIEESVNYTYVLIHLIRIYGPFLKRWVLENHDFAVPSSFPPSCALCPNNLCGLHLYVLCLNGANWKKILRRCDFFFLFLPLSPCSLIKVHWLQMSFPYLTSKYLRSLRVSLGAWLWSSSLVVTDKRCFHKLACAGRLTPGWSTQSRSLALSCGEWNVLPWKPCHLHSESSRATADLSRKVTRACPSLPLLRNSMWAA